MAQIQPQSLIGTWRRFGIFGPVYEIISQREKLPAGGNPAGARGGNG